MLIGQEFALKGLFLVSGAGGVAFRALAGSRVNVQSVLGLISAHFEQPVTSIFAPEATPARLVFGLSMLVLSICAVIFSVVAGLLCYTLIRFRHRATDGDREPAQIYGSTQVELSWTVIPTLIVVVLFLATARVIFVTEKAHRPKDALGVVVIGHQFWWEFRYPKLGIVTANELHVPVSDPGHPTPTYLTMSSADTDHSFWVPRLAGKLDVIPNKINIMWIDPERAGLYLGQCAQYCGVQHAKMLIRVYADSASDFAAWADRQRERARQAPDAAGGRAVFERNACVNCHTISGTGAKGTFGPNLSHVASRATIASGVVPMSSENVRAFVENPSRFKPGVLMPAMHLSQPDLDAVTQYLMTLR